MDLSKLVLFFFNNTAAPAIYTLSLHDALPILYTRARYLPPSKVEETEINDSIISDGCIINGAKVTNSVRSEEHTSELQSRFDLVCRLLLEKKKNIEVVQ